MHQSLHSTANTCQADAFHKSHTEIVRVCVNVCVFARMCVVYVHMNPPPVPLLEVTSIYLSCVVT